MHIHLYIHADQHTHAGTPTLEGRETDKAKVVNETYKTQEAPKSSKIYKAPPQGYIGSNSWWGRVCSDQRSCL